MELGTSETKYRRAQDSVAKLKRFYVKMFRGILAIIVTGALNYYLNEWTHPWFLWVVFGVGLSLSLKAFKLFGTQLFFGKDWEERKIRELMTKDVFKTSGNFK